MFYDAIVVLGKTQFAERIVERSARGDEKHRHMQPAPSFRRFVLGHPFSSREQATSGGDRTGTGRSLNQSGFR
jgi:hypothetical protein